MAERRSVRYRTVTVRPLGADRRTTKAIGLRPLLPSRTRASSTVIRGAASSSRIVPTPRESAIVAPDALDRLRLKVSLLSSSVSPRTGTVTVRDVEPAGIVRGPDTAGEV